MAFDSNAATLNRNDLTDADGNVMTGSAGLAPAPKLKRAAVPGMTDYPTAAPSIADANANAAGASRYPGFQPGASAAEQSGSILKANMDETGQALKAVGGFAANAIGQPLGQFAKGVGLVTPSPISSASAAPAVASATPPSVVPPAGANVPAPTGAVGPPSSLDNASQPPIQGTTTPAGLQNAATAARAEPGRTVDLGGGNSFSFNGGGNDALARKNLFAGTPTLGSGPTGGFVGSPSNAPALTRAAISPQGQLANAQQDYASDVASIINKDPRSPLGVAAYNADRSLSHQGGASRYGGGSASPAQSALASLLGGVQANYAARAGLASGDQSGGQALALQAARADQANTADSQRNQFTLTRDAINRENSDRYVVDPGTGKYAALNGTTAKPVTDAAGQPFGVTPGGLGLTKEQQNMYDTVYKTSMANPPQIDNPAFDKSQPEDAVKNSSKAQMTEEQIHQMAMQRALGKQPASQTSQLTGSGPPKDAAEFLRQNPSYRDKFDQKYGPGASAKALGN